MWRWAALVLPCLLAACGPVEDPFVADRFRGQIRTVYAEAERVQALLVIAQEGCRAIQHLPDAYWQMRCVELVSAPSQLTVTLIEKGRWR